MTWGNTGVGAGRRRNRGTEMETGRLKYISNTDVGSVVCNWGIQDLHPEILKEMDRLIL